MHREIIKTIEREPWTELDAFHQVMAQTFHPAEMGNLEPIRARSDEMLGKAIILQNGSIPPSFNNAGIIKSIGSLVTGSRKLNHFIRINAEDETIFKHLNSLHDTFHTIKGLCRH